MEKDQRFFDSPQWKEVHEIIKKCYNYKVNYHTHKISIQELMDRYGDKEGELLYDREIRAAREVT